MDKDIVTAKQLLEQSPGVPEQTVYSRIRKLIKEGELVAVGHGVYSKVPKVIYHADISTWMRDVCNLLIEACVGINYCVTEKDGNLILEVDKPEIPLVRNALQTHGYKVLSAKAATSSPVPPEGYVILGPYYSEMPVMVEDSITVASLEKSIVDSLCGDGDKLDFQKKAEAYRINFNRMRRYAARRGKEEILKRMIQSVDTKRIHVISSIQKYLKNSAITKAWVFGSFARGEESASSDLDLLVEYDSSVRLSLLDVIRYQQEMEELIGRDVDLVQNGYLKPFAAETANRDKYLIYER